MEEKQKVFTREYFVEQGKRGGDKTKELYGLKHYSRINPGKIKKPRKTKVLDNPLE